MNEFIVDFNFGKLMWNNETERYDAPFRASYELYIETLSNKSLYKKYVYIKLNILNLDTLIIEKELIKRIKNVE
jgi:hypothetical protein